MQIINLPTVSVGTSATVILTQVQAQKATELGMECVCINPSVNIVLVDATGGNIDFPGAVAGTTSNSPFVCFANTPTIVRHRGGIVTGISTSGTATVAVGIGYAP